MGTVPATKWRSRHNPKRGLSPFKGARVGCAGPSRCMARKPRDEVEAGLFHIYARGNEKRDIFRTEIDSTIYINRLGVVTDRTQWRCLAYCLMPNHVHLL